MGVEDGDRITDENTAWYLFRTADTSIVSRTTHEQINYPNEADDTDIYRINAAIAYQSMVVETRYYANLDEVLVFYPGQVDANLLNQIVIDAVDAQTPTQRINSNHLTEVRRMIRYTNGGAW